MALWEIIVIALLVLIALAFVGGLLGARRRDRLQAAGFAGGEKRSFRLLDGCAAFRARQGSPAPIGTAGRRASDGLATFRWS